jgi:aspartate/tyrosine/aromatic aminotransferase
METNTKSAFDHVIGTNWDPIIEILEAFRLCEDHNKINLTVGAYRDEDLNPVVFRSVKEAERRIFNSKINREYLSPLGDEEFCKLTQTTIFKPDHEVYKLNKILTVQSLAGSGTLRLGGELVSKFITKKIYIPHLTWPNHNLIFAMSGMEVICYRFYDEETKGINMKVFLEDLNNADEGSAVVLHVCGNNPTGVDPNVDEWKQIMEVVKRRNLFTFFDLAYQGFISGDVDEDIYPIHLFYDNGLEMFISQSFSKSMGLYGERAAPLHIIVNDPEHIPGIKNELETIALGLYLTPTAHGSRIIKEVLRDEELRKDWLAELKTCVNRLKHVRNRLYELLVELGAPGSWEHIKNQHGMFSYIGLNVAQCEGLINKHKVFLVKSGRISLSGINEQNVRKVAEAIKDVATNY